jgi:Cu/Zn superoxide dismutase
MSFRASANDLAAVNVHIAAVTLPGRTIVVHEKPDDYKSQPVGNPGQRIACGVVS